MTRGTCSLRSGEAGQAEEGPRRAGGTQTLALNSTVRFSVSVFLLGDLENLLPLVLTGSHAQAPAAARETPVERAELSENHPEIIKDGNRPRGGHGSAEQPRPSNVLCLLNSASRRGRVTHKLNPNL